MQMWGFLIHMYHSGKDVALADFLLHKADRLCKKGFDVLFAPALEELRTGGNERIHEHGAVLASAASRRLYPAVALPFIGCGRLNNMEVVLAAACVDIGVAGILLLGALVVGLQPPGGTALVLCEP